MKTSLFTLSATLATALAVAVPAPFQIGTPRPLPADIRYVNLTNTGSDETSLHQRSDLERRRGPAYAGPEYQRLFYCNSVDFYMGEGCREDAPQIKTCYNFPSWTVDQISSLKSGPNFQCDFFTDYNCRGAGFSCSNGCEISQIGSTVGPSYNDNLNSYACYNA